MVAGHVSPCRQRGFSFGRICDERLKLHTEGVGDPAENDQTGIEPPLPIGVITRSGIFNTLSVLWSC